MFTLNRLSRLLSLSANMIAIFSTATSLAQSNYGAVRGIVTDWVGATLSTPSSRLLLRLRRSLVRQSRTAQANMSSTLWSRESMPSM